MFALFTMYMPPLFPTLLRTTGAGFCYNIGRIAAAFGTVFFGLFSKVGDYRLALFYAGFLFLPAAAVALFLPEPPDERGERGAGRLVPVARCRRKDASDDRHALPCSTDVRQSASAKAPFAIGRCRTGQQLPPGWSFVEVVGVATDSAGNVFVFNRGEHPVIVFDRAGPVPALLGRRHLRPAARHHDRPGRRGLSASTTSDHTVHKFTPDGQLLLTLGHAAASRRTPAPRRSTIARSSSRPGRSTFPPIWRWRPAARCTSPTATATPACTAFRPTGDCSRSWGEPGAGPGQFHVPHGIAVDRARHGVRGRSREQPPATLLARGRVYRPSGPTWPGPARWRSTPTSNVFVAELGYRAGMFPGNAPPPGRPPAAA